MFFPVQFNVVSHAMFPSSEIGCAHNVSLQYKSSVTGNVLLCNEMWCHMQCCFQYERQHEKEQTQEMTEKLDQDWKDIRLSMGMSKVGLFSFHVSFFINIESIKTN